MSLTNWRILATVEPPTWLSEQVGRFAAQLLCQREIVDPEQVAAFLSIEAYQPTSAFAFPEMSQAIARIQQAWQQEETIAIWGDFDADGITATSVLWEGLGQFFPQGDRLFFYIPDRLKESHGISISGLDELRSPLNQSLKLIITCDTGSTSLEAINYANDLGIDVIITDHHTLPDARPPVVAIINPRYLPDEHPLFHLSGVAVAYKLMEALSETFHKTLPEVPQQPIEDLLDLVAIGLVADLVRLTGDCRYLAQKGIEVLRQKKRLGVRLLLEQCKRVGDRPIDISFGIAPRINAVSRIWGDVRKCVELLTTRDEKVCKALIEQTELANIQRKALQAKVFKQVKSKIEQIDLSTTGIIVLADPQWSVGVLGLVAGQVVAEYGRPTILCTVEDGIAKGSARSLEGINLYELLKGQEHLLLSFGGHPLAGGLSFNIENLSVLVEAIDQKFWSQYGQLQSKAIAIDLEVKISDLTKELFNELRQLDPFGMGNPYPRLLVKDCVFSDISNANIRTQKGQKVEYIKTEYTLSDRDGNQIYGDWWGHYRYELPDTVCDVVIELVDNAFRRRYDARLIDFHVKSGTLRADRPPLASLSIKSAHFANLQIIDWRGRNPVELDQNLSTTICNRCPQSWQELNTIIDRAHHSTQSLALVYPHPEQINGAIAWQTLVGIAKYLSRTGKEIRRSQLVTKLGIDDQDVLQIGFDELQQYGYDVQFINHELNHEQEQIIRIDSTLSHLSTRAKYFIQAANELAFQQQFFDRQLTALSSSI